MSNSPLAEKIVEAIKAPNLKPGDSVVHKRYGQGEIVAVHGNEVQIKGSNGVYKARIQELE